MIILRVYLGLEFEWRCSDRHYKFSRRSLQSYSAYNRHPVHCKHLLSRSRRPGIVYYYCYLGTLNPLGYLYIIGRSIHLLILENKLLRLGGYSPSHIGKVVAHRQDICSHLGPEPLDQGRSDALYIDTLRLVYCYNDNTRSRNITQCRRNSGTARGKCNDKTFRRNCGNSLV